MFYTLIVTLFSGLDDAGNVSPNTVSDTVAQALLDSSEVDS